MCISTLIICYSNQWKCAKMKFHLFQKVFFAVLFLKPAFFSRVEKLKRYFWCVTHRNAKWHTFEQCVYHVCSLGNKFHCEFLATFFCLSVCLSVYGSLVSECCLSLFSCPTSIWKPQNFNTHSSVAISSCMILFLEVCECVSC